MFIYNKDSINKQVQHHFITITLPGTKELEASDGKTPVRNATSGTIISGILDENFTYTLTAEWKQLINIAGISDVLETVMKLQGNTLINAGGITKQYYTGTGYVPINAKFRVYSDKNVSTIKVVSELSQVMLPDHGLTIGSYIKDAVTSVEGLAKTVFAAGKSVLEGAGLLKAAQSFLDSLGSNPGQVLCHVNFSNWMNGVFVLKSVTFTYSNEMCKRADAIEYAVGPPIEENSVEPYYVDIEASFESYMIPVKSDFNLTDNGIVMNLMNGKSNNRVTFGGSV